MIGCSCKGPECKTKFSFCDGMIWMRCSPRAWGWSEAKQELMRRTKIEGEA
jgi:hypothetical protein